MKRLLVQIALAVAYAATSAADADLHTLVLEGKLSVADNTRTVNLRLLCNPDADGGAISVELWVPHAFTRKDFDYDHFEGPDAAARNRALSQVSIAGKKGQTEIRSPAAGWYSGEEPDTFVFGLSQLSHKPGKIATLLRGVNTDVAHLVWRQKSFDDPTRELRATFALDVATVTHIRETVDPCLTTAVSSKPAALPPP